METGMKGIARFLSKRRLMSKRNLYDRDGITTATRCSSSVVVAGEDVAVEEEKEELQHHPEQLPVVASAVVLERSPNETTVALFFRLINRHQIQELATQCFAPTGTIAFQSMSTSIDEFCSEMESIVGSFPNFDMSFASIVEEERSSDGAAGMIVIASDVVATGTHTGAAYGFGPFPAVAKSHRTVRNDPERYEFHLDETQRITHCRVRCRDAGASLSGPAGFYEQVGGFPCL